MPNVECRRNDEVLMTERPALDVDHSGCFRHSSFGLSHSKSFVILRSAFSFRPAISPPTQLLQLIRRGHEKASVHNVRLPDEASELVEVAG
jgi:hypothetical protein